MATANPRADNGGYTIDKKPGLFIAKDRFEFCQPARKALAYYRRAYTWQQQQRNLRGAVPYVRYGCEATRRRAVEWRDRFRIARKARFERMRDQQAWWEWLPDKWQRIGACETGYGKRPGNWRHNSGSYQGAFGFANQSWDSFVPHADPAYGPYPSEAYLATPRQQYEVALAIYRRYGLSGWGCRAA